MQIVTTEEVEGIRAEGETPIINVLDPDSFEHAHIPGSENIPISEDDFVERVEELVEDREAPVLVHCSDPDCEASPTAAKALEEAGFTEVLEYEGGLKAWLEAGNTLVRHGETAAASTG